MPRRFIALFCGGKIQVRIEEVQDGFWLVYFFRRGLEQHAWDFFGGFRAGTEDTAKGDAEKTTKSVPFDKLAAYDAVLAFVRGVPFVSEVRPSDCTQPSRPQWDEFGGTEQQWDMFMEGGAKAFHDMWIALTTSLSGRAESQA